MPFLKSGVTLAVFQSFGYIPVRIDFGSRDLNVAQRFAQTKSIYCRTSLLWPTWGQNKVAVLERWPLCEGNGLI